MCGVGTSCLHHDGCSMHVRRAVQSSMSHLLGKGSTRQSHVEVLVHAGVSSKHVVASMGRHPEQQWTCIIIRNWVKQNTFITPHTGTSLESQDHSCVRKFAFRFGDVALRAPPNGNRQRRLSSCSPQCPSYPLPGDYRLSFVGDGEVGWMGVGWIGEQCMPHVVDASIMYGRIDSASR